MAQIQVNDLTFSYDGSADDVFENVTFRIDTDWKLGLIGRNGKVAGSIRTIVKSASAKTGKRYIVKINKMKDTSKNVETADGQK